MDCVSQKKPGSPGRGPGFSQRVGADGGFPGMGLRCASCLRKTRHRIGCSIVGPSFIT